MAVAWSWPLPGAAAGTGSSFEAGALVTAGSAWLGDDLSPLLVVLAAADGPAPSAVTNIELCSFPL